MIVKVKNGEISEEEKQEYVNYLQAKFPNRRFERILIELDVDFVNLSWVLEEVPFDRIRRITGYLVGNMTRWNDGKRAEEHDRVKHTTVEE